MYNTPDFFSCVYWHTHKLLFTKRESYYTRCTVTCFFPVTIWLKDCSKSKHIDRSGASATPPCPAPHRQWAHLPATQFGCRRAVSSTIPESVPCVSLLSLCLGTCVQRNSPKQLKRSVRTGCECSKQVECHLLKLPEKALVGTEPQRFGRPQLGFPHSSVLLGETPVSGESLSLPLIGHW